MPGITMYSRMVDDEALSTRRIAVRGALRESIETSPADTLSTPRCMQPASVAAVAVAAMNIPMRFINRPLFEIEYRRARACAATRGRLKAGSMPRASSEHDHSAREGFLHPAVI